MTRLKGVVLLQMTMPGAPTIYYGDEVGLVGPVTWDGSTWQDDPYNRLPYPWLDETGMPFYTHLQAQSSQDDLFGYYQTLTTARNNSDALRVGSFDTLLVDDGANVYAYGRLLPDYSDAAVVVVNRATGAQAVTVNVSGYLPSGATFTDELNGGSYTVDTSGNIVLSSVPGMSGAVLVLDGALAAPPAAVSDLMVTAVSSSNVDLNWSAAAGATSYDVYRSLVSGGGYALVSNVAGTSFSDTGLTVATNYYYVVVGRDDATGLVAGNSNEAAATTAYSSGWADLQWPSVIPWFEDVLTEQQPPVVLSQRGFHNNVRPFVDPLNLEYLQKWYPKIAGFHSVSKAMSATGDKLWKSPKKLDKVVYTGIALEQLVFSENYRREKPLQLLSIGRAHWIKGYDEALLACKILKEKNEDFRYTIIGGAGDEELQFLIADLGLTENVVLTPRLPQRQVFQQMAAASVTSAPISRTCS